MKERLTLSDINKGYLKGSASSKGWALCIGAGTSLPIFPSWLELVGNLILKDPSLIDPASKEEILSSFSLDALIQAYSNIREVSEDDFTKLLSGELYAKLKAHITLEEWDCTKRIFTTVYANRRGDTDWATFIQIRERLFKNTTAYILGEIIVDSIGKDIAPEAILSFNAEPLLYSIINSFERGPFIGKVKESGDVRELIDLMTTSTSSKCKARIPYYFCHGALLSELSTSSDPRLKSINKLVFSEGSYLQLAGSNFSWQATTFLHYCSSTVVIFVGVSLTDPNMRKWLSWIQKERNEELSTTADSTQHFWISKKRDFEDSMRWAEAAVFHLGIRIIWIDDWSDTGEVIRNLIGI